MHELEELPLKVDVTEFLVSEDSKRLVGIEWIGGFDQRSLLNYEGKLRCYPQS